MPKIRMRTTAAGPTTVRHAGRVYRVTAEEAALWLGAGAAERLLDGDDFDDAIDPQSTAAAEPGEPVETAAAATPETSAERTGRSRPRSRG